MSWPVDHLGLQTRLQPDRLAAKDLTSGRAWTYAGLDRAVGQCVSVLIAHGVGAGDRVAALARNRVELVILHLACARLGAVFTPLNWRLSSAELAVLVEDAGPALVFGDACLAASGLDGVSLDRLASEIAAAEPAAERPIDPERPSLILYTSGTSGRPKGVLLSERNIVETASNFSLLGRVSRDSVFLCDAPMFHIIGLVTNIRPALMRGGAFLVSEGFSPPTTLARLSDPALAVTHYFCVPQMAAALRAEPGFDPKSLRGLTAIFTGGAPLPPADILAWLDDGVAIANGYGMSEAGTVFGMPPDAAQIRAHLGSAGVATSGVQTRIVDAEGFECSLGQAGELLLRGPNVTAGYWRRDRETAEAFTADGWLRTGDIALADADGYHWLIDRKKDMFISGGENIYPAEFEAVLAERPEIAECAVVGVADPRWGEVGHLVVVAAPGWEIDPSAIRAYLDSRLARYKAPKHITIVDALPRNGAGKVLKTELRQRLSNGAHP